MIKKETFAVFTGLQHEAKGLFQAAINYVNDKDNPAHSIVLIDSAWEKATSRDVKTFYVGYGDTMAMFNDFI